MKKQINSKTYTITISGYGAEVYCHKISLEQRNQLNEIATEGIIKNENETKAAAIVGVEDLFMDAEGIKLFEGSDVDDYTISVAECAPIDFEEDAKILHEINTVDFIDFEYAYDGDYLFAVNRVKGTFGMFELILENEIDISKITVQMVDINFQISLLTDVFYDGKKLKLFDVGDTSSKSITLILKDNPIKKTVTETVKSTVIKTVTSVKPITLLEEKEKL